MKLASYVIKVDKGFAPNPFGGFCTLAACTPNRAMLKLEDGDWIVGNSSKKRGHKLVYAMRVSSTLEFYQYFDDARFQMKKPRKNAAWENLCGDNIYFKNKSGSYEQAFTQYHSKPHYLEKDTGARTRSGERPKVYVSDYFFYFGENAPPFPDRFKELIYAGRGCRYATDSSLAQEFVRWLADTYEPGINGLPHDREESTGHSGKNRPRECAPRPRPLKKKPGDC
jgi:hypothetical protein